MDSGIRLASSAVPRGPPVRVLLVDPYLRREDPMERKEVELYPSLGLLSLASYLRARGHEVAIHDLTFQRGLGGLKRAVHRMRPHLVGVHTKTLTFPRSVRIARIARSVGALALAGGPDSSSRPRTYLEAGFHAVALGEGEETLAEVARRQAEGRPYAGTPGLAWKEASGIRFGPPRPLLRDLDSLPLPAWDLVDMERYLSRWERATGDRRMAILTSRGCPFDCSWCSKPSFGRSFRQRSVENVLSEVDRLREEYRVDYVRICDDVFGIQRRWTEAFLDGMIARGSPVRFECLSRVDLLKPALLPRMKRAGLSRVFLGVESGSQRMLDLMNRGTTLTQIERAASALRAEGIRQYWFLMLGYPGETLSDIEATVALFRRFAPEEYSVSVAVPLPGTRFHDLLRRDGRPTQGGHVVYEGVYPASVYRVTRARLRVARKLAKADGRFSPSLLARLRQVEDALGRGIVEKVLIPQGRPSAPARGALPTTQPETRSPGL